MRYDVGALDLFILFDLFYCDEEDDTTAFHK